jgi:hypothetical protein
VNAFHTRKKASVPANEVSHSYDAYFYQIPTKEEAWCGYCISGALANFAVAALTLPEAAEAIAALAKGKAHNDSRK